MEQKVVYSKLSSLDHVLARPDAYLGDITLHTKDCWVYDEATQRTKLKEVTYNPGFLKTFDEILVNAADARQRGRGTNVIKVQVDPENNRYSVWNDGPSIPIEIHDVEKCWTAELVFGSLRAGENFQDGDAKLVGGKNGFGAKLANIYSTHFLVEIGSAKTSQTYSQTWENNMKTCHPPVIKSKANAKDYTRITVTVDIKRFQMTKLDPDTVLLMHRRVLDIAGISFTGESAKVYWNGVKVPICNFKQYVNLYLGPDKAVQSKANKTIEPSAAATAVAIAAATRQEEPIVPRVSTVFNDRWMVTVAATRGSSKTQQMSFVNSLATTRGGKHVKAITDQIVAHLTDGYFAKTANAKLGIKAAHVRSQLWIFINCLIVNPSFDSQTKEFLTTNKSDFGSSCELPAEFLAAIVKKSGIVERITAMAEGTANKEMKKTDGKKKSRLTGLAKLSDANLAGTKRGSECTLILTEGDSAKALVESGLEIIGRDLYGVYPLKGKVLNVREASPAQIQKNAEITAIKQIMGLQQGMEYKDTKTLRYGHLMVFSDADADGSHIKGLIINLFQTFWPSLYRMPGFLKEFITPIIKCTKRGQPTLSFFTVPEYQAWVVTDQASSGWTSRYYKGLGTSTAADAKVYFSDLPRHTIDFTYEGPRDDEAMALAFSKKQAAARKTWLLDVPADTFLDMDVDSISYHDFVHKELILFSLAANARAIPSMVDGLKIGQRKILYACFKRKLFQEIKVAQLAGYVSEHACYHHGEVSLQQTIVKLAQDFVGSNNINLLLPKGQFGTRAQGGDDAASARYIFTTLSPLTRLLFHADDDHILTYLEDDGQRVEPKHYLPILPMVLVSGATGIGHGSATDIPCYNPLDIVHNLRILLDDYEHKDIPTKLEESKSLASFITLTPFYDGFTGRIEPAGGEKSSFTSYGRACINADDPNMVTIEELPIGTWTQKYKVFLEGLLDDEKIKDFKEYHTDRHIRFIVTMPPDKLVSEVNLVKFFHLSGDIQAGNLVCFNEHGKLCKYATANDILKAFFNVRLPQYTVRKEHLCASLSIEVRKWQNKVRFITAVNDKSLNISNLKRKAVAELLRSSGYEAFHTKSTNDDDESEEKAESSSGFNYLLSLPMGSMTGERSDQLKNMCAKKEAELAALLATSPVTLWRRDLDAFTDGFALHQASMAAERAGTVKAKSDPETAKKRKRKTATTTTGSVDSAVSKPKKMKAQSGVATTTKKPRKRKEQAVPKASASITIGSDAAIAAIPMFGSASVTTKVQKKKKQRIIHDVTISAGPSN